MRDGHQRQTRQRRLSRRVSAWMLGGYVGIAVSAAGLKAWQTAVSSYPVGWLAKTNVIVWDTVTLAAALGALALGVREMVLAYFIRKEYEEDIDVMRRGYEEERDTLLRNQQEQAETVRVLLADAHEQREANAAFRREQAERDAAQNAIIQQLLEQNRQLIERLDRRDNGHGPDDPESRN